MSQKLFVKVCKEKNLVELGISERDIEFEYLITTKGKMNFQEFVTTLKRIALKIFPAETDDIFSFKRLVREKFLRDGSLILSSDIYELRESDDAHSFLLKFSKSLSKVKNKDVIY